MMIVVQRLLAGLTFFALLSVAALGQSASAPPTDTPRTFQVADVHTSPHTMYPFSRSTLSDGVFIMRQANMVDLIAKAYRVDPNNVAGGPSWMEADRFDIYAKTPPKASPEEVNQMLRALLADRFKLVVHTDSKPLPAFVLSAGKGALKMTESDGSADSNCQFKEPPASRTPGALFPIEFSCHNMTMATFADNIHQWAGDYLTNPVVDSTGLKGAWDFNIKWTQKGQLAKAGADGIPIFDAVDKQLGLKLEAKTAPLPVVAVDSVNEKPTANSPDLAKLMPPPPPSEFEVATVKPSGPDEPGRARISPGQVDVQGIPLQFLITFAYDINDEMLVGAPKWLNVDKFDIVAKVSSDSPSAQPGAAQLDMDDLRPMLRKLLADRFNLQAHMEDRPLDAYNLVADHPKLKIASPNNRTACKEGPGDDGKDPRIANPILGRLLTCRNMTMAQFAAMLQSQASGYIHTPVLDTTGIDGAYDITLSFSTAGQLRGNGGGASPTGDSPAASDPNGAVSFLDAVNRQLGLKLVKVKRPIPALVIEHIDEKPTEN